MEKYEIIKAFQSLGFVYEGNELNDGVRFEQAGVVVKVIPDSFSTTHKVSVQKKGTLEIVGDNFSYIKEIIEYTKLSVTRLTGFEYSKNSLEYLKTNLQFLKFFRDSKYDQGAYKVIFDDIDTGVLVECKDDFKFNIKNTKSDSYFTNLCNDAKSIMTLLKEVTSSLPENTFSSTSPESISTDFRKRD